MQKIAYGRLGLTPQEFWRLTVREFSLMIEGANEETDNEWRKLSQLAAWIVQPHTKNKIKASDLYMTKKDKERMKVDPEEKRSELEDLAEVMKIKI